MKKSVLKSLGIKTQKVKGTAVNPVGFTMKKSRTKKFLDFFCAIGIHFKQTRFREYGRIVHACKNCHTEWS